MKRFSLLFVLILCCMLTPLFGATAVENAAAYTRAARKSLDAGYFAVASDYADTAIAYCEASADAWYLKALAEKKLDASLSLSASIETLEHCFAGGAFFVDEDSFEVRMWLSRLCYETGRYQRAAEVLIQDPSVTLDKLILLSKIWYAAGETENARECIETGIQMYPSDVNFYLIYFENEDPAEAVGTELCERLTGNVSLFSPEDSDIYLYASRFVDRDVSDRYVQIHGLYRGTNPLYPIYALEKGFMNFDQALSVFDSLCRESMQYSQLEQLATLAAEENLLSLYQYLDAFDGILLFDTEDKGIVDLICFYQYGRPYMVYYDEYCDSDVDMHVVCDYGTPLAVFLPHGNINVTYDRFPSVSAITFADDSISLSFARNACSWKGISMEKASFSTDDFAFFIPVPADPLEDVTPVRFTSGCSVIECTSDDPAGCSIRIVMNGGKPVDAFYTVRGKLYAHAYFKNGELLYRDVDMDGDGLYELSEQYSYDAPEADEIFIGNRIFGTVADCFVCPRFSALLSDSDGDGFYEYEETINTDGTSDKVWY